MEILTSLLYKAVPGYVSMLFGRHFNSSLVYHNLEHTRSVVSRAMEIAGSYELGEQERFVLFVAAWFHDTGQLFTVPEEHEHRSVGIMREFLLGHGMDGKTISLIEGCILATRIPHQPETFLEQIICDADTYNLGTDEFITTDDQLREELSLRSFDTSEGWHQGTLAFLRRHRFFTSYCQQLLLAGKQKNMDTIIGRIKNSGTDK